jgi:hypothetical protein
VAQALPLARAARSGLVRPAASARGSAASRARSTSSGGASTWR